ncbi:fusarin C cluster-transporter [Fusarium circinatum]|uniref:Efflux pump FUS6 n=1 Tax=Fusarium circinatum TaxID=48490 RepID=A0A8H5U4E1_FUSCI|nr:fusarin C cluster-transporter [Fusarium circinatum]
MINPDNHVPTASVSGSKPFPAGETPQPENSPSPEPTSGSSKKGVRFWLIFFALALTTFLAALDTSIISTALPTIAADLGSESLYVWIIDSYLLASTATIPICAQAANIYGRRSLTLLAVCIFTLGSGLCGGAHNTAMMIGGRAVQGVGGGGILAMSEIVVCDLVSVRQRGMYAGILGCVWAIAAVVAPVMGGSFAQNISWRWIFYINIPIASVCLVTLGAFLKLSHPPSGTLKEQITRIDLGGSVFLIGSVTSIVLALSWGGTKHPWSAWQTVVPLVIGLVFLLVFLVYQGAPWLREPTMPLRLFSNRTSSTLLVISFIHSSLLYWICYFLPVFFQVAKEASPTRSAVMLFPIACTSAPAGIAAGILITKTGKYRIWHFAGFVLMSIACGLFTLLNEHSSTGRWVGFQILFGIGTGVVFTSTLPPILASLPDADVATATGAYTFIRNFGSIWGVAIPAAVFNNHVNHAVSNISDPGLRSVLIDGGAYEHATKSFIQSLGQNPKLKAEVVQVYIDGLKVVWQVSLAFSLVGFVLCFFVQSLKLRDELNTELLSHIAHSGFTEHTMNFETFFNIVAGKPRGAEKTTRGINPLNRSSLWPVPVASASDVEDCIQAAREAFPAWSETAYKQRTALLEKFADLYVSHSKDFCQLIATECGRTLENAAIEVHFASSWLRYPSKYEIPEETVEDDAKTCITTHEPLGVVAAICPWNSLGKIAPALATGNCVILKPSPFTPYSTLKVVELAQQVFPPSVLQVLHGDNDLGPTLVNHPHIQKITFTGSTSSGKQILKDAADSMKRVTLETAGNNPCIILPDVDINAIIPQLVGGLWFNAGQVCIAPRRMYIHQDVFEEVVARLTEATANLATGLAANIGPVQNETQFIKLKHALQDARATGYELLPSGQTDVGGGFVIQPTIIKDPPADANIVQQENFGPIVSCFKFSSLDEAVSSANSSDSGLAAVVWSSDVLAARSVAAKLEAGNVYINGPPQPDPYVPFGGHKQSGLGVDFPSIMEYRPFHGLQDLKKLPLSQNIFEALQDLTLTKAIGAFAVLFLIVPSVFDFFCNILSPITSIPGPVINKCSPWPLKIANFKGKSHRFSRNLHRRYGPIVVLAPGIISIGDSGEIKRIIQNEDWVKSEAIYGNFRQDPERPTLLAFTEKKAYSRRKRMLSSMFGIRYIRSLEPLMKSCVDAAVAHLDKLCDNPSKTATINLQHFIHGLAIDIIGITTFGGSFHVVENGSHPLPSRLKVGMRISAILQLMSWVKYIPFLPTRDPYIENFTFEIADKRRKEASPSQHQDLLQHLVDVSSDSPGSEFRTSDVQDESVILLAAGSETTANAELFTIIQLLKYPEAMKKLVEEVDKWYPPSEPDRETDCAYSQAGMTYLQACIDETMRLIPGQATGSPRQTSKQETLLGYRIPKGTTVFPNTQEAHLDSSIWEQPEKFIPERWLDIYAQNQVSAMPYWPFSAGSRVCIGKNFAFQEMHISLTTLLRKFTFEYVPGQDETTVFRLAQQLEADSYKVLGNGAYSSHAALQREAMLKALPLFQQAIQAMADCPSPRMTIVEYGSAHGNNSLEPIEAIMRTLPSRSLELVFSDRPENDFGTLSKVVTTWTESLDTIQFPHQLFLSMVPRSFYRQIVPPQSAHLGFSLAALHHLDYVPQSTGHDLHTSALLQQQAHLDLSNFLSLRAQEIVSGGSLVLSFVGKASAGYDNYSGPVDSCRNAMIAMVQQGKIPVSVAEAFMVPTFDRTLDDVRKVLDGTLNTWKVHHLFEEDVSHPAIHELRSHSPPNQEASQRYADIVIYWMMAVCSGYFTKALRVGCQGSYTKDEEDALLQDWITRAKEFFIHHHKDEAVRCSFIYVHVEKI